MYHTQTSQLLSPELVLHVGRAEHKHSSPHTYTSQITKNLKSKINGHRQFLSSDSISVRKSEINITFNLEHSNKKICASYGMMMKMGLE